MRDPVGSPGTVLGIGPERRIGLVESFDKFSKSMIGEDHYLFFANYVGAMFLYIWISNAWPRIGSPLAVRPGTPFVPGQPAPWCPSRR